MKFSWVSVIFLAIAAFLPLTAQAAPSLVQPKIIGGEDAAESPSWMAYFFIFNRETQQGSACGASLISTNWLVTAAHCVEEFGERDYEAYVAMDAVDLENDDVRIIQIDQVLIHPDYVAISDRGVPENDIALIRLSTPVTDLAPVDIINSIDLAQLVDDDAARIYGWGETGSGASAVLQFADVSFQTQDTCDAAWGGIVSESSVCSIDDVSAVCFGDSGGPMTVTVDGQEVLVGITSYGAADADGNCVVGFPDVFMSPAYYFTWIAETVGLVALDGNRDIGYVGVGETVTETLSLVNYSSSSLGITSLSVGGADADKFTLSDNQCGETLLPGARCALRVSVSSAAAGDATAHVVLDRTEGEDISYGLTATFLPAVTTDAALQVNGGRWYSNGDNTWQQSPSLGSSGAPGFTSGADSSPSLLLFHVDGPLQLLVDGASLTSALFDGVMVHLNNVPYRWYRMDGKETTMDVAIPEGSHRVLFAYEKTDAEGSEIGLYNIRTTELSDDSDDDDSGGSLSIWVLLGAVLLAGRRWRKGWGAA